MGRRVPLIPVAPWGGGLAGSPAGTHAVQFYDDDEFLKEAVFDFCVAAFKRGDPVVLLATRPHHDALRARFVSRGYDWDGLCDAGEGVFRDATEVLASIMVGAMPDQERFEDMMQRVLEPWEGRAESRTVRIFGELVDLLCRDGNGEGAVRLEDLWNAYARNHRLSLLCAYSMGNFYRELNGTVYPRICAAHDDIGLAPGLAPRQDVRLQSPIRRPTRVT